MKGFYMCKGFSFLGEEAVGGSDFFFFCLFFFFLVIKMKMSKRLSLELITSYPVSKASLYPNANLV